MLRTSGLEPFNETRHLQALDKLNQLQQLNAQIETETPLAHLPSANSGNSNRRSIPGNLRIVTNVRYCPTLAQPDSQPSKELMESLMLKGIALNKDKLSQGFKSVAGTRPPTALH